jgi:hypothetical protein
VVESVDPFELFESSDTFEAFVSFSKSTAYSAQQRGAGSRRGSGAPSDSRDSNVASDPAALALLRQVVDAKGGLAALKGVRTVIADAETRLGTQGGEVRSTTKTYVAYPDQFRVDATIAIPDPAGSSRTVEVIQTYNAGRAWVQDPGGVRDAPEPMREDFAASVRRDTFPLLIGAAEGRLTVRRLPDEGVGQELLRVLEIRGAGLDSVRLYIDRDLLIAKQSYSAAAADGQRAPTEELYSDYRTINGIRVPFQTRLVRDGNPVLTRTLANVTFNSQIDPTLFNRPR